MEAGPGWVCRSKAHDGPVLLVEAFEGRYLGVPYPVSHSARALVVPAEGLEPVLEDGASARVLQLRWHSAGLTPAAGDAPPVRSAMVLCAGLGTRLRPLSDRLPKPAIPFFGRALLHYSLALLHEAGVERVVVNTHHLAPTMEGVARRAASELGLALDVTFEPVIQGTAGGIREARRLFGPGPVLVLNGDAFASFDLKRLVAVHLARRDAATLAVIPMPPGQGWAAVQTTQTLDVMSIAQPGPPVGTPWHFVGAHVLEPSVLDLIPREGPQDINRVVYPAAIAAGLPVRVCPVSLGAWADLGSPGRLIDAWEEVLTGLCDLSALGASAPIHAETAQLLRDAGIAGRRWVHRGGHAATDAVLDRAAVGPGSHVSAGAVVRRSVVLDDTRIEAGERLQDSVAWGSMRVGR